MSTNNQNLAARSQNTLIKIFLNIVLIITVLIVLYPIAFTIGAAFTKSNSLASTSIVPWPKSPSLYQFQRLLTPSDQIVSGTTNVRGTNYITWYKNTLKIAIMNTILTVILCTTTGYIFSRFKFGLKKPLMASMIVLQLFPSFIGMIATYVILWRINGLDTHWGLVLVYATGSIPYNSWLMKGYFDSMPRSIEEAARVDGASPFGTYLRIIVPSARPQIVFLTLVSFTGPWMDFIFPRLVLRSDAKKTLAVGLFELINGRANDNFTMFAAGALLVAIPFAILFIAGQKNMLLSLAGDGLKE
jgi:arabinogalactan oligomer/maltooligosaccharide transport system permease protein